jgi:hypothetical protein
MKFKLFYDGSTHHITWCITRNVNCIWWESLWGSFCLGFFPHGSFWGLRRNFIPLSVNTLYLNILLKNIYICMWSIVIYYIIYIFIQNVYKFWLLTSTLLIKHLITKRKNHCILQIINPFQFSLFSYDVCSGTLKWLVVLISAFPWHR